MQAEIYSSDDYAGMKSGVFGFYYGYEETDPETEEWMFVVKKNNKTVYRASTSFLESKFDRLNDVRDFLLAGVSTWMLLEKNI